MFGKKGENVGSEGHVANVINADGTPMPSQSSVPMDDIIFDVTTAEFQDRVVEASMSVPVIVDFWAPWCGPCKQLMPALEAAVTEMGGKVLLAKVNIDDEQQLAAALRVQSVPTVFGFFGGQPVEAFQGNVPPSQIKAFITKLIETARQTKPDALDIPQVLSDAAQALADDDVQTAHMLYAEILRDDPVNPDAHAGLLRVFVAAGQIQQAQAFVDDVPDDIQKSHVFQQAQTALDLAVDGQSHDIIDTSALETALENDENDHAARFDMAESLFASGDKQDACDHLLYILRTDMQWNDEAARQQLLKYFEAMGHADPITISARKSLSSLLFS